MGEGLNKYLPGLKAGQLTPEHKELLAQVKDFKELSALVDELGDFCQLAGHFQESLRIVRKHKRFQALLNGLDAGDTDKQSAGVVLDQILITHTLFHPEVVEKAFARARLFLLDCTMADVNRARSEAFQRIMEDGDGDD